jgi:hypothetical protein
MGCVVNGPGEARDADLGIAAGNKRGHLFVKGQRGRGARGEMVDALVEWAEFIADDGIEGALTHADVRAQAEADADRAALLTEQGADANDSEQKVERLGAVGPGWTHRPEAALRPLLGQTVTMKVATIWSSAARSASVTIWAWTSTTNEASAGLAAM